MGSSSRAGPRAYGAVLVQADGEQPRDRVVVAGVDVDPHAPRRAAPLGHAELQPNRVRLALVHHRARGDEREQRGGVDGRGARRRSGNASVDRPRKRILPLNVAIDGGVLSFTSAGGITVQVTEISLPFSLFRMDFQVDAQGQNVAKPASLFGSAICGNVPTYGIFLRPSGSAIHRLTSCPSSERRMSRTKGRSRLRRVWGRWRSRRRATA